MLFEKINKTINKYAMISRFDKIVVAVSGGIDSMALLNLLHRYSETFGATLVIAHLDHGLREDESDRDEEFVKSFADSTKLPFVSKRIDLKKIAGDDKDNIQSAGRKERYAFFREVMKTHGGNKIALAHNSDDQAETSLMRIIRGTGIKGLGGIPPVRGEIIRPLIEVSRQEIEEYAKKECMEYVEDSSNIETKYLRNRIRHELIPMLKSYNPKICEELNNIACISREIDDYLNVGAAKAFADAKCRDFGADKSVICLNLSVLNTMHSALRKKVITVALGELLGDSSGFFYRHIMDIEKLIMKAGTGSSINLPRNVRVEIEYNTLLFGREPGIKPAIKIAPYSYSLKLSGKTRIKECEIVLTAKRLDKIEQGKGKDSISLDMDKLSSPLEVRNYRKGDRIQIEGMKGRKKLKNLFIDEKTPQRMRQKIPVLCSGEEIIWVVGIRAGGTILAGVNTKNILQISKD